MAFQPLLSDSLTIIRIEDLSEENRNNTSRVHSKPRPPDQGALFKKARFHKPAGRSDGEPLSGGEGCRAYIALFVNVDKDAPELCFVIVAARVDTNGSSDL